MVCWRRSRWWCAGWPNALSYVSCFPLRVPLFIVFLHSYVCLSLSVMSVFSLYFCSLCLCFSLPFCSFVPCFSLVSLISVFLFFSPLCILLVSPSPFLWSFLWFYKAKECSFDCACISTFIAGLMAHCG